LFFSSKKSKKAGEKPSQNFAAAKSGQGFYAGFFILSKARV